MIRLIRGNVTPWAMLIGLTMLSYVFWLDPNWADRRIAGSGVVMIAGAKVWLIGMRFMELGTAIPPLRMLFNLWVIVIVAVLTAMFWE